MNLELDQLSTWEQAVSCLNVTKATGYDGWSTAELRSLKGQQLHDLARLFQMCCRTGFPTHLAQARVNTLAKVDVPSSMADGRPITVFACVYRLWASIVAKQALQRWASWLPQAVTGCVPGRSVRDIRPKSRKHFVISVPEVAYLWTLLKPLTMSRERLLRACCGYSPTPRHPSRCRQPLARFLEQVPKMPSVRRRLEIPLQTHYRCPGGGSPARYGWPLPDGIAYVRG